MRHRLVLLLWLTLAWVALWRDLSVANTVSGLLVAGAVVWLFPPADETRLRVRPLALLRFVAATAGSIVRANLVVAWEVVTPKNRINEGVVAVELASNDAVVITLVSHAIILAPGTMVIDIDKGTDDRPTMLYVHVLHLRGIDEVRDEVLQLEKLALAAVTGGSR
ncbi:MAG: Na+/H+ antiporter subunit E [Acidimicrobiales bacterium]